LKYGARHLKRAIERNLVNPLSNLMATGQIRGGDLIRVGFDKAGSWLTFVIEEEDIPVEALAGMVDASVACPEGTMAAEAAVEQARAANAQSSQQ
jgi:ATP-dependent Clp protease ATP-binding subunit ClpB